VFKIVGWADAQGNLQSAKPRAVAAPPSEEPTLRAATRPAETPSDPAPRQGQRRRPAAR